MEWSDNKRGKGRGARGKGKDVTTSSLVPRTPSAKTAKAALIIFAKAPIAGQVKTRLSPPLTSDEAATLHGSLALDAVERSGAAVKQGGLPLDRFVACSPSPDHVFFKILQARYGVRLIPQIGEDLGARMCGAFDSTFALGYRSVILLGTDLPLLPTSCYGESLRRLTDHDLVLGPAVDGGYYLIGLTRSVPDLFKDIPWSTDQVFSLTLRKAEALGMRTSVLDPCRDVDRLEDLLALIEATRHGQEWEVQGGGPTNKKTRPTNSASRSPHPSPPTFSLSKRTAGVLQMLASRLQARTS